MLRQSNGFLLEGLVGSEWKYYSGIIEDWYTESREPYLGEVEQFLREAGQSNESDDASTPKQGSFNLRDVTGIRDGGGLQIIGAGPTPVSTPSAESPASGTPPESPPHSRGGIRVSPHPFPEMPQAPRRDEFPDEEAFEEAMAGWMHTYGKIVAMRLKYGKPRGENEGPSQ